MATRRKYETDAGTVVRIRLSDAVFTLAGTEPAGAVTESNWFVSVSTSKRSQTRLKARGWKYSRAVTVAGEDKKLLFTLFIPKLTPAAYSATQAATVDYGGEQWTEAGKSPEE